MKSGEKIFVKVYCQNHYFQFKKLYLFLWKEEFHIWLYYAKVISCQTSFTGKYRPSLRTGSRRGRKKNLASAKQKNSESEAIVAGQGRLPRFVRAHPQPVRARHVFVNLKRAWRGIWSIKLECCFKKQSGAGENTLRRLAPFLCLDYPTKSDVTSGKKERWAAK